MRKIFVLLLTILQLSTWVDAQELLQDVNGDGVVTVMAFGDSISYGQGDYNSPYQDIEDPDLTNGNAGYLKRVRDLAGLATENSSVPGEELTINGVFRFPVALSLSSADVVAILEGTNDISFLASTGEFQSKLQKMVNIAKSQGRKVVLFTILPTCCNHAGRDIFINEFNRVISAVAIHNELPVADIATAWRTTCQGDTDCYLFNIPDGLHPNRVGYDLIGQTFLASLYGINILAPDGAAQLESALGLAPGQVIVKPIVTPEAAQ